MRMFEMYVLAEAADAPEAVEALSVCQAYRKRA
jgi:hypothetical protein